jgi:hypothetical protein
MIHVQQCVKHLSVGLLLGLSATAGAATVSSDDLARCAGIALPTTRLACYDALAHRAPDAAPPAAASLSAVPASPVAPAAAVAPMAPVTPAPGAAPPAAAAAIGAPDDPKSFGLSAAQRHVAFVGPKEEAGRIVSFSANQAGHSTIVLDNGQTWTVLDDDGWLSNGDEVTIKRATLGSFLMTTPSHHTFRVHRVQ